VDTAVSLELFVCGPNLLPLDALVSRLNEQMKKGRQDPSLASSSSWMRSNPQFNAGEVSRALVSLDFNRSQVNV
jgi:hypothetical protein